MDRVVSSDAEELVLVDERDVEIGHRSKAACHEGAGLLHRAFSIFLFDERGQVLLQQRSPSKQLWPLYWSNSCCSHPRRGEPIGEAVHRRLAQELGLESELQLLYKFRYHASFGDAGSENEYCWVFAGACRGEPAPNPTEVADWRFVSPAGLSESLLASPERYTPWLRLEWQRLEQDFRGRLPCF